MIALFKANLEHFLIHIEFIALNWRRYRGVVRSLNVPRIVAEPALIGLTGLQFVINVFGVQYFTCLGIDNKNLAGSDTALGNNGLWFVVIGTNF